MFRLMNVRRRLTSTPFQAALWTFAALCAVAAGRTAFAQGPLAGGAREGSEDWFRPEADPAALKRALDERHISDRWIYHDLDAAREQARKTGQPILAVFCCVPCGVLRDLDGALATAGGAEASRFAGQIRSAGGDLAALLDEFIAVRVVKMNGVNRNVFRFDRDLPYAAMFLNADGVVYGRYGVRGQSLRRYRLSSFQRSLRRALELHRHYPRNAAQLASKRNDDAGPAMAEDASAFEPFPPERNPEYARNCIHCHTVGETEVRQRLADGRVELRDVWPFPPTENLGLELDLDDGLRVDKVAQDSLAGRAGVRSGDLLLSLADQPLTSEADVQWAMHVAPDRGKIPIVVRRGERTVQTEIVLEGDWRRSDGRWRDTLGPLRPWRRLRPDPDKEKLGVEPSQMALAVVDPRRPAAQAGLRGGDLLVAVDGRTDMLLEADFLKHIHIDRPEARSVELTVLRKGTRLTVMLPVR